uniref:Sodium-dependent multivitamin transporter n=1 Tax=Megaselia scalaris TaxID=36166 RepID=T1H2Q9_MEGSC
MFMPEISRNYFHVADYVVMSLMILGSAAVGIYFAFKKSSGHTHGQASTSAKKAITFGSADLDEYLLGSRKMHIFPVAMSLVASYVSAVTVIGTPTDIYYYGSQYWMIIISVILMGFVVSYVYLPVFQTLRLNSSYQYLELRFNFILRSMASFMFVMDEVLFLPMVVFVPSITFNQVTGFSAITISAILVCVCVFYTLL